MLSHIKITNKVIAMDYIGWFWDYKTQDFYRWKDLPNRKVWPHFCEVEKCTIVLDFGSPCYKCGKTEKSS